MYNYVYIIMYILFFPGNERRLQKISRLHPWISFGLFIEVKPVMMQ